MVSRIFGMLGIPLYNADERAKQLYLTNQALKQAVMSAFGPDSYTFEGLLNRPFLAAQIFSKPQKRALLNGLVHPYVFTDYTDWANENRDAPYVLKEAAIMFETGSNKQMDKVIAVTAPLPLRISRIAARDTQRSEADIKAIIAGQLPEAELIDRADFVVVNNDLQAVLPQVLHLDTLFRQQV